MKNLSDIMPQEIIISPPKEKQVKKTLRIGIIAKMNLFTLKKRILGGFWEANNTTIDMSALTLNAISQMIVGERSFDEIGGPIAIAKESGKSIAGGAQMYLLFIALLSGYLGLLTLPSEPVRGGGRLVFILYEAITCKLPNPKNKKIFLQLAQ